MVGRVEGGDGVCVGRGEGRGGGGGGCQGNYFSWDFLFGVCHLRKCPVSITVVLLSATAKWEGDQPTRPGR